MEYKIPVDYNLEPHELVVLDKLPEGHHGGVFDQLASLRGMSAVAEDEVIERIMRHAIILFNRPDNQDSLAACIHQAIVWEVG